MPLYRKKPVTIEARLLTRENFDTVGEWAGVAEGTMKACLGDWVIKGVQGEFYPVKDSIFRETYESAEEDHAGPGRLR